MAATGALGAVPTLTGHLVTTVGLPDPDGGAGSAPDDLVDGGPPGVVVSYDVDGGAHRAYGYRRPTLLLVRPDGHVAVRPSASTWSSPPSTEGAETSSCASWRGLTVDRRVSRARVSG